MQFGRERHLQPPEHDAVGGAQHRRCHRRDGGLGCDAQLSGSVKATETRDNVRVGDEDILRKQRDLRVHGGVGLGLARERMGGMDS